MKNYKKVRRVLWTILFANIFVAFIKIALGIFMKSNSMSADGLHSLIDGSSNIVGLVGIYFASMPVDDNHPYGHKKYEMIAGIFISIMLFVIGIKVVIEGIIRLINPINPDITLLYILLLILTILINIIVSIYERQKGQELNSQILISDSIHTKSDIFVSIGVLITLICIKLGIPTFVDSISSFIIAVFILHSAYEVFKDNSSILIDSAIVDTKKIIEIGGSFKSIKEIHKVKSRGTKNDIYIDMHVMTEPNLSVGDSHKLVHELEDRIKEEINKNIQITVHLEPFNSQEKKV